MPHPFRSRPGPRRLALAIAVGGLSASAVLGVGTVARADPPTVVGGPGLAGTGTSVATGAPALPTVTAGGWLVADLTTGDVLAAHDAHGRYAPASTLKILTALTVIPELAPATQVTATAADASVDGTRVGVVPGHRYTVASLLQAMLMVSGNDAATALATQAGGVPATIAAMNAEATSLRAYDTTAKTVDGLDAAGQTSSAYDLALLTRAALQLPAFRTDVGTSRAEFSGSGVAPFAIANHNPLLGAVPGVYGVKNGYTNAAQASYVGAATRGGHDLVVVVMRTVPDFVPESKALFDWGFAADGHVTPVGTLDAPVPSGTAQGVKGAVVSASTTAVAPTPEHDRFGSTAWLTGGVVAGTMLLLLQARREQVRRRRRRRPARRAG